MTDPNDPRPSFNGSRRGRWNSEIKRLRDELAREKHVRDAAQGAIIQLREEVERLHGVGTSLNAEIDRLQAENRKLTLLQQRYDLLIEVLRRLREKLESGNERTVWAIEDQLRGVAFMLSEPSESKDDGQG